MKIKQQNFQNSYNSLNRIPYLIGCKNDADQSHNHYSQINFQIKFHTQGQGHTKIAYYTDQSKNKKTKGKKKNKTTLMLWPRN